MIVILYVLKGYLEHTREIMEASKKIQQGYCISLQSEFCLTNLTITPSIPLPICPLLNFFAESKRSLNCLLLEGQI